MANLDTRDKRASALGATVPGFAVFANPDGSNLESAGERAQALYLYQGLFGDIALSSGDTFRFFYLYREC